MPIPRNWSEELVCEWLCLMDYSTEVGIEVGTGSRGGRKEADVVGVKIKEVDGNNRTLDIYHVEIGQLGGESYNIDMLSRKFSKERIEIIENRYKERFSFSGDVKYTKLYIDIWRRGRASKLMNNEIISDQEIQVWSIRELHKEAITVVRNNEWHTLPESCWMIKLMESLDDSSLLLKSTNDINS